MILLRKLNMFSKCAGVCLVMGLFAAAALAQNAGGKGADKGSSGGAGVKTSTNGKHTTINFEDQLVEGGTNKPELFYLLNQKKFNYKRLIRLREDFLPEMRKTSEDIS